MARSRESKIELTAYDDLFETDQSREEANLSKVRDIPISENDKFPAKWHYGPCNGSAKRKWQILDYQRTQKIFKKKSLYAILIGVFFEPKEVIFS